MKIAPFGLVAIIGLFAMLRLVDLQYQTHLLHDEGITLLSATGHEAAFDDGTTRALTNAWQPAERWITLVTPPEHVEPRKIARDLSRYDIHPPLYFVTLGYVIAGAEDPVTRGLVLNIVLSGFAFVLLYAACRIRAAPSVSLTAVAIVAFMPIIAGAEASVLRQYEMLMAATAGLTLAVGATMRGSEEEGLPAGPAAGVAAAVFLGLMTHVQFVLAIAALLAPALLLLHTTRHRFLLVAAVGAGLLAFVTLNQGLFRTVRRQRTLLQEPNVTELIDRLWGLVRSTEALTGLVPFAGTVATLAFFAWVGRGALSRWQSRNAERDRTALVYLSATLLVTMMVIGQYVSMNAPRHAIGGRYYFMILPFLGVSVAVLLGSARRAWIGVAAACLLFLTSANTIRDRSRGEYNGHARITEAVKDAGAVVANNPWRGVLSPLLAKLEPGTDMLLVDQTIDLERFRTLVSGLDIGDVIYLRAAFGISKQRDLRQFRELKKLYGLQRIVPGRGYFRITGVHLPPFWTPELATSSGQGASRSATPSSETSDR